MPIVQKVKRTSLPMESIWFDGSTQSIIAVEDWVKRKGDYALSYIVGRNYIKILDTKNKLETTALSDVWIVFNPEEGFFAYRDELYTKMFEVIND